MRQSLMSKKIKGAGGGGETRLEASTRETSAIKPDSPEQRAEEPKKGLPRQRPAKWPLAMIGVGVLLTVAWAALLIWLAVTFLGDVFMPPGEDPVEELLRRSAPPGQSL